MSAPSRRALLGAAAVLPLAAVPALAAAEPGPDAELIRACAEHIRNLHAYNASDMELEPEDDPLWAAYEHTRDAISDAEPRSLAGMRAKALAAKAEARTLDGEDEPDGCPAGEWAWNLVNDLLRLTGGLPA